MNHRLNTTASILGNVLSLATQSYTSLTCLYALPVYQHIGYNFLNWDELLLIWDWFDRKRLYQAKHAYHFIYMVLSPTARWKWRMQTKCMVTWQKMVSIRWGCLDTGGGSTYPPAHLTPLSPMQTTEKRLSITSTCIHEGSFSGVEDWMDEWMV